MQTIATATLTLTLLLCVFERAPAQQWSIDLHDVTIEDPEGTVDREHAESVEFLGDGKVLVTAGYSYNGTFKRSVGEVQLRDVADGSVSATLRGTAVSYAGRAGSLAVSSSGKRIAAAGWNSNDQFNVDVFDAKGKKLLRTLKGDPSPSCIVFSPDESVLAAAHFNGTVEFWNHESGDLLFRIAVHDDGIGSIAFSPDGKLFATGNGDGSVSLRRPRDGKELGQIPAQPELDHIGAVVFSPDSRLLAAGGSPKHEGDSPIYVWQLIDAGQDAKKITASKNSKFEGHHEHTYSLAFSPDGRMLASANQDATVGIWDLEMNKTLPPITDHSDFAYDVAFSPGGTALATLGRDSLKLWTIDELRAAK